MKCLNCGNEFTERFCPQCGWGAVSNNETDNPEKAEPSAAEENPVSKACKMVAGIYMVLMVISGFVIASDLDNYGFLFGIALGGIFTGMILWGIGEIIRLLHEQQSK